MAIMFYQSYQKNYTTAKKDIEEDFTQKEAVMQRYGRQLP